MYTIGVVKNVAHLPPVTDALSVTAVKVLEHDSRGSSEKSYFFINDAVAATLSPGDWVGYSPKTVGNPLRASDATLELSAGGFGVLRLLECNSDDNLKNYFIGAFGVPTEKAKKLSVVLQTMLSRFEVNDIPARTFLEFACELGCEPISLEKMKRKLSAQPGL